MHGDGWTLGHRPNLDGLRGIAILLVLLLHYWPAVFVGGGYGVDLFFVLSGFLITRLLIEENHRTGTIDIKAFYVRRARRLMPALVVVLAICAAAPGAIWTALYVANWARANGAMEGPLEHTWSLAIEEQFYLLWPPLFFLLRRSRYAVHVVIAAVVLVTLHRMDLAAGGAMYDRLANGTDTRVDMILIGCALAFVAPLLAKIRWAVPGAIVAVPLAALSLGVVQANLLTGGYLLLGLGWAVVLMWAVHGDARALGWGPLRSIGLRAYSLYLWHYPVLVWLRNGNVRDVEWATTILAIVAGIVMAEVSYRWIESPFRHRAVRPARDEAETVSRPRLPGAAPQTHLRSAG